MRELLLALPRRLPVGQEKARRGFRLRKDRAIDEPDDQLPSEGLYAVTASTRAGPLPQSSEPSGGSGMSRYAVDIS
jgi:hypothetical protein